MGNKIALAVVTMHLFQHGQLSLAFNSFCHGFHIVMPSGKTGFELAEIAQERWPSLRVVLTSGFPDARINGNGMRLATRLLNKPYRKQDLAKAVREALDNSADTANILAAAGQEMNRAAGR
jgi:FixJ family two-component response regulator